MRRRTRFVPSVDSLSQRIAPGDLALMPDVIPAPVLTCDMPMPDPVPLLTNVYGEPVDTQDISNSPTPITLISVSTV